MRSPLLDELPLWARRLLVLIGSLAAAALTVFILRLIMPVEDPSPTVAVLGEATAWLLGLIAFWSSRRALAEHWCTEPVSVTGPPPADH